MWRRIRAGLSYGNVMATIAVFVALGGSGYAAVKLNGKNLANKSVAGKKLKNRTVGAAKIKRDALTGKEIRESTLGKVPSAGTADLAAVAGTIGGQSADGLTDPTAYAMVNPDGTIAAADRARNITSANIVHETATGSYCFVGLPFEVRSGIATGNNGAGDAGLAQLRITTPAGAEVASCPAGTQARVVTPDPGGAALADHGFYVWFSR